MVKVVETSSVNRFVERCHELARQAQDLGEAAVGSVVVRNLEIVGEGYDQVVGKNDVTAHAELTAIRAACAYRGTLDLSDCVLYTNIEPCWMCSFAIRQTRIKKVVVEKAVDDIGGITSCFPILSIESEEWGTAPEIEWISRL